MSEPDFPVISAVVTFHNEGLLAHKALLGLERVRSYAEARGISVELVTVLDCADTETERVVKSSSVLRGSDQVMTVSNGDVGASRNSGIAIARGSYIGIFDGDDYYSNNWLHQALAVADKKGGELIVHPEYTITFGTDHNVSVVWDMDDNKKYSLSSCFSVHPWVSCSFGKKEIYLRYPYHRTDPIKTGFGYEDWHWNLELVSQGVRHVTAKETALFYRRKAISMLTKMDSIEVIIRPSNFFNRTENWRLGFEKVFD